MILKVVNPNDIEIRDKLKEKDVYSIQPRNRMYLLEKLENFENSEPVVIDNNPDITIEHIFPQNPDAKWKLQPEFLEKIKVTQQEIIQQYSRMVKAGGQMVYATCSVLPSENQKQVDTFLASDSGKGFTFIKDKKVLAHKSGFDGFYMALLERKL